MRILSMSGFVPEQICDTVRFTQYAGDRNISHYCGYVSDFISQVMQDETFDGAVFPKSCDSTRIIKSYLSGTDKFLYQICVPSTCTSGAIDFFADCIRDFKRAVEAHYNIEICNIAERAMRINRRNRDILQLYNDIENISFADYLGGLHEMFKNPLVKQEVPIRIGQRTPTKRKVFLVGSFLSNLEIARTLDSVGLTVVGDTLPESGRLVSAPDVDVRKDIYRSIAESMLLRRCSPTQNQFREIIKADVEELKRKDAKGVIFITQKYCEPYDYLFSVYKSVAEGMSIPILKLSLSDTEDSRKTVLALEAFADTL